MRAKTLTPITIVRKARVFSAVAMRNTPQLYDRPPKNVELAKSWSQHVDPVDHHQRVAEALGNGHDRVDDARVVQILAARARHAAGEDAQHQRKTEADHHERDDAGPEQVAGETGAETLGDHRPDAGCDPLVHEADRAGVGHGETADEAAGLACEGEFFCRTPPLHVQAPGPAADARRDRGVPHLLSCAILPLQSRSHGLLGVGYPPD